MLHQLLIKSLILSLLLGIGGCSVFNKKTQQTPKEETVQESQPSWVTHLPTRTGYAYGVASSEIYSSTSRALDDAKKQAKVELLAGIKVEISSQSTYSKSATLEFQGNSRLEESFNQKITSKTSPVELSGIQTTQTWIDERNQRIWALAELDTNQAANKLLNQLDELDKQIIQRGVTFTGTKLEKIRWVQPSLPAIAERQKIIEHLNFLNATSLIKQDNNHLIEKINQQITTLLSSLTIQLKSTNSEAKSLEATLAKALTELGFTLTNQQADLTMLLESNSNLINQLGLFIVHSQGNGQLITQQGETLKVVKATIKEVSGNQDLAKSKAAETLAKELADQLFDKLYLNL